MITTFEEAKHLCHDFGIPANRSNHRRIRKGNDMASQGYARMIADFDDERIYIVLSQTDNGTAYTVRHGTVTQCTCPDQKRTGTHCKHTLAVSLLEGQQREEAMIASIDEYESNHFACQFEGGY